MAGSVDRSRSSVICWLSAPKVSVPSVPTLVHGWMRDDQVV